MLGRPPTPPAVSELPQLYNWPTVKPVTLHHTVCSCAEHLFYTLVVVNMIWLRPAICRCVIALYSELFLLYNTHILIHSFIHELSTCNQGVRFLKIHVSDELGRRSHFRNLLDCVYLLDLLERMTCRKNTAALPLP